MQWLELDLVVTGLRKETPDREIWRAIEEKKFTRYSIWELKRRGWKVHSLDSKAESLTGIAPSKKLIVLNESLEHYDRDKALFQELVYTHFQEELDKVKEPKYKLDNAAIVQWLSRQSRAKFYRLRSAVYAFELKPQIYDEASYKAFGKNSNSHRQIPFPFAGSRTVDITNTLMD